MNVRSLISIATSWTTGIASVFVTQAHLWIGLFCALTSLIASLYAILVARTTLRLRELEYRDQLCSDCRYGNVPVACPIPEPNRPADCPLNKKGLKR
jgi:hypothetical protein